MESVCVMRCLDVFYLSIFSEDRAWEIETHKSVQNELADFGREAADFFKVTLKLELVLVNCFFVCQSQKVN